MTRFDRKVLLATVIYIIVACTVILAFVPTLTFKIAAFALAATVLSLTMSSIVKHDPRNQT